MLNISKKSISAYINREEFKALQKIKSRTSSKILVRILMSSFIIFIAGMFLPWTQNIRSSGQVSTLNPFDKPQEIQTLIDGKIEKWFVKEGDIVSIGDTIVLLAEAKEEYLDPDILSNTRIQEQAKSQSADAYTEKIDQLNRQILALNELQDSRLKQLSIELEQLNLEVETTELELEASKIKLENAENQLTRMQDMYDKGVKALTDLEAKKLAQREANAKNLSVQNKLNKLANEKNNARQQIEIVKNDYEQKLSKLQAEIRTAESYRYDLMGESNKLRSKFNQLEQRQNAYVIRSPIEGRITKVLKNGIGEFLKAQESIATIVPNDFQKAVELYIEPNDMPLIEIGNEVRLQFDGWPSIVFSGWPNNSLGTFEGIVYAVDNDISENGKYRIIVIEDPKAEAWPTLIRIGSGARGLLLLKDVKVYYEIWRQLNGFPPDFYRTAAEEKFKQKAPLRRVK